jgi:hypothetical protein
MLGYPERRGRPSLGSLRILSFRFRVRRRWLWIDRPE